MDSFSIRAKNKVLLVLSTAQTSEQQNEQQCLSFSYTEIKFLMSSCVFCKISMKNCSSREFICVALFFFLILLTLWFTLYL